MSEPLEPGDEKLVLEILADAMAEAEDVAADLARDMHWEAQRLSRKLREGEWQV